MDAIESCVGGFLTAVHGQMRVTGDELYLHFKMPNGVTKCLYIDLHEDYMDRLKASVSDLKGEWH